MRFSPTEYHVQMLPEGGSAKSSEFKRSLNLYKFVLLYHDKIQNDMVSRGGENIQSLSELLSNGKMDDAHIISGRILQKSDDLRSDNAYSFIDKLNALLESDSHLKEYRM